jgi:hypothetical protein
MASQGVVILVIILVLLIIIIIAMLIYYFWSVRKKFIRNNLTYLVQQGTSNSTTDIFELDTYQIYVCNRTPITITMSSNLNQAGKLYYISNFGKQNAFTIAGNGLTILQQDNIVQYDSLSMYVFLDNNRLLKLF